MSYRDYLVQIKKEDFNKLKQYQEKDKNILSNDFFKDEEFTVQNLCYGPKIHIILEIGLGYDFQWERSIPESFPFTDFSNDSFQIMDKEKFKELIKIYKNEYKEQLLSTLSKYKDTIANVDTCDVNKVRKELKRECEKAVQKAESDLYELDYVFSINTLEERSNGLTEPLIKRFWMQDTLINLFYIYYHFDWNTSYLIYASW